jgi:PiT family inorganic phosphate transporter
MVTTLLVVVIVLAIAFDYINGFHDAANSIATIVSTKVLSPISGCTLGSTFQLRSILLFY